MNRQKQALDPQCELRRDKYHVYEDEDHLYTVMLNQTDVTYGKKGHNKFYACQMVENDRENKWFVYKRWGRVGAENPQDSLDQFTDLSKARKEFVKTYKKKTGNVFGAAFDPVDGKYSPIEVDFDSEPMDLEPGAEDENDADMPSTSSLDERQLEVMAMITNKDAMDKALKEHNIDVARLPVLKIADSQVLLGFEILERIEELVSRGTTSAVAESALNKATNEFYTAIPHSFGMSLPPTINTIEMVKRKVRMLENLRNIGLAGRLLLANPDSSVHPMDNMYARLGCKLQPIDATHNMHAKISELLAGTHAPTHDKWTLDVANIFTVERRGEEEQFEPCRALPNRKLLWHGSRTTNFAGILSNGLRIAPPEAPSTGYMFGKFTSGLLILGASCLLLGAPALTPSPNREGCVLRRRVVQGRRLLPTHTRGAARTAGAVRGRPREQHGHAEAQVHVGAALYVPQHVRPGQDAPERGEGLLGRRAGCERAHGPAGGRRGGGGLRAAVQRVHCVRHVPGQDEVRRAGQVQLRVGPKTDYPSIRESSRHIKRPGPRLVQRSLQGPLYV